MMIKKYIYILCFCNSVSLLFSLSDSRLLSTWDMPSSYTLYSDYINNSVSLLDSKLEYDVTGGASFAYEHAVYKKEKFNLYTGAQLMLGKKSDVSLAFHSLYLMPTYTLNKSSSLLFKIGYSNLNSDDDDFPTSAYMFSIGSELEIADGWAINFCNTWYQTGDKKNIFQVCPTCPIEEYSDEVMFSKIKYNVLSVSLVYEITKKEERKSSSKSKGR